MKRLLILAALATTSGIALAAPVEYQIDSGHTYPSFEADHMGISFWRGKFNRTTGTLVVDKAAGTGSVEVSIDMDSVDFGLDAMNDHARAAGFFDTAQYPTAIYKGRLEGFVDGAPTRVAGELTLHGITRPVELKIDLFKCVQHPMRKREVCGANATAVFKRDEFGLATGKDRGFSMEVALRIQMEAVQGGLEP